MGYWLKLVIRKRFTGGLLLVLSGQSVFRRSSGDTVASAASYTEVAFKYSLGL